MTISTVKKNRIGREVVIGGIQVKFNDLLQAEVPDEFVDKLLASDSSLSVVRTQQIPSKSAPEPDNSVDNSAVSNSGVVMSTPNSVVEDSTGGETKHGATDEVPVDHGGTPSEDGKPTGKVTKEDLLAMKKSDIVSMAEMIDGVDVKSLVKMSKESLIELILNNI